MQKEHNGDTIFLNLNSILFTKRILFSILYWKLLILCRQLPCVVKDILTSCWNQICWNIFHSATAKLVFRISQILVFDIVLYFLFCSSSKSCFFLIRWWSKIKRFNNFPVQFKIVSFLHLGKASVNWIQRYFNLLSRLYSDLI